MSLAEPQLARMAWLLTGDRHRAEELVQQALVKTYVAWGRARDRDPLAYARRVLANTRIDTWRRRRREVLVPDQDLSAPAAASDADTHADRDVLVRALAQIAPKRRRVVVLRYLMDLSEQQVADELGISVGAVKSAASRGISQLRDLLGVTEEEKR
jgi:RNA polymerase sigma-70 factor (sigma-E family)